MSKNTHAQLKDAISLHHNLLHAEQQAISAKDLDTIEDLLNQKDHTLKSIQDAQKLHEPDDHDSKLEAQIADVLALQERNTENFRRLHIQDHNSLDQSSYSNPLYKRMKQAYSK